MTEESKDLIKKDLLIIKQLHQKTDYTQTNNIKSIYNYVISKGLLKTHLGQKYLNRLLYLQEGLSEVNTCIICMKQCEDNPLVCNQCNNKLLNTNKEQANKNQGIISAEISEKSSEKPMTYQRGKVIDPNPTPPASAKDIFKKTPEAEIKVDKSKKKSIWKLVGTVVLVSILFFYTVGSIDDLQDDNDSTSSPDNFKTQKEQFDEPQLTGEDTDGNTEDNMLSSQQNKVVVNAEQDNTLEDTVGDVKVNEDGVGVCFDFTEEELMGQIHESLASYQLDIGTKKGYSNIYFVLEGDTASNVVYQIALNEDSKVQTISINILAPITTLEVFSKAVAATILICDPTITYNEMQSLIDMTGSPEFITINDVSYVAGPLSQDQLSFLITKEDMHDEMKVNNNSWVDNSNTDSMNEDSIENIYVDTEGYALSTLLGMKAEEVQKNLGYPIYTEDTIEYYSDILSIYYENEVASKIILGLEERFDFTQIEIPESSYSIEGIHLGDDKETVLAKAKDARLFILDGVFYGNTYQIELDGYYVNVDFFTLEDREECPTYRVVITRLIPVY